MKQRKSTAPAQRITPEQAAALVQSGMWLDYGAVLAQPDVFDQALAARTDLAGVKLRACLSTKPRAVVEADPQQQRFHFLNTHFSGYDRKKHDAGVMNYLPVNLGEIPDYYRRFIPPVDMLIVKTGPMDGEGRFNLGPANLWHRAIIERAKCVVVEESTAVSAARSGARELRASVRG